jgi:hypothetical protein
MQFRLASRLWQQKPQNAQKNSLIRLHSTRTNDISSQSKTGGLMGSKIFRPQDWSTFSADVIEKLKLTYQEIVDSNSNSVSPSHVCFNQLYLTFSVSTKI